jgi:hypothetical protein
MGIARVMLAGPSSTGTHHARWNSPAKYTRRVGRCDNLFEPSGAGAQQLASTFEEFGELLGIEHQESQRRVVARGLNADGR